MTPQKGKQKQSFVQILDESAHEYPNIDELKSDWTIQGNISRGYTVSLQLKQTPKKSSSLTHKWGWASKLKKNSLAFILTIYQNFFI